VSGGDGRPPRVSVVVPARNASRYLGDCLESVLAQTMQSVEVLLVDDASTDGTLEIARGFAERDDRVRLLRHDRARGAGGARNTGIDAARGDYLFFVDADDWLRADALERIWSRCRDAGAPVGLFPAFNWIETEERLVPDHRTDLRVPDDFRVDPETLGRIFVTVWTRIYQRELVVQSGVRFPERLVHQDEYFHYCFFARVEPRVVTLDERIYVHRFRPGSTMDRFGSIRSDMPTVFQMIWDFLEEHGLVPRYGPLFCRTVAVQLRHILPQLDRDAQEPFYDGVREIVRKIDRSGLDLELPEPLPDLREHGYLAYLQRRQRQLREIEADPWRRLGTLGGAARARRMLRLGLEEVGLGPVADRLARLVERVSNHHG